MENTNQTPNNKPLNFSTKTEAWPIMIIMASIATSLFTYQSLPAKVASHWNIQGQVDGWASREFHVIFFPALMLGIYLLMNFIPRLDPRKERYQQFASVYLLIRNLIISVFLIIFLATTVYNLGYDINIGAITAGSIGVLMIIMGNYFGKLKRNWFIGIRTPWTLSSENSWNKTHRLGGKVFMIWGMLLIATPWLPPKFAFVTLGSLLIAIPAIFAYSYIVYKKDKKDNPQK